jgi:L-ascorbate metabolism protein UlaG (beta-lactamase superfamily)
LGRIDAVVVSHEHYDHCDLEALAGAGFDLGMPLIGPGTVAAIARGKEFRDVRAIEAWEATAVGDLTVTATPGQHGVHEVTFVIQAGEPTVFFGWTRCTFRRSTPSRTGSAMSTWPSCRPTACTSAR